MKKYLGTLALVIALGLSYALNLYLIEQRTKENLHKIEILELTKKKLSTYSKAKQAVYQDSINNVILNWLVYEDK